MVRMFDLVVVGDWSCLYRDCLGRCRIGLVVAIVLRQDLGWQRDRGGCRALRHFCFVSWYLSVGLYRSGDGFLLVGCSRHRSGLIAVGWTLLFGLYRLGSFSVDGFFLVGRFRLRSGFVVVGWIAWSVFV